MIYHCVNVTKNGAKKTSSLDSLDLFVLYDYFHSHQLYIYLYPKNHTTYMLHVIHLVNMHNIVLFSDSYKDIQPCAPFPYAKSNVEPIYICTLQTYKSLEVGPYQKFNLSLISFMCISREQSQCKSSVQKWRPTTLHQAPHGNTYGPKL